MIYTVTFNPSLDYVVQAEQLVPGEINRTTSEAVYPGGKGVNVSVILSNLGLESTAFGFTAGFTEGHGCNFCWCRRFYGGRISGGISQYWLL